VRYHTPIGPIRFDIGYNLNPPVYPVIITYGTPGPGTCVHGDTSPCYGQSSHLNYFFSIGQSF
jgi:outer membrane protein insertion porin family